MANRFVRSVIWQALDRPGTEYSTVQKTPEGWLFNGTVCRVENKLPTLLSYRIFCDKEWRTRKVKLKQLVGNEEKKLSLKVDRRQYWSADGLELHKLRGCIDVDLLSSPVTNTIPIRRLSLRNGQSHKVRAAWVKFPEMSVEPLGQKYTRLGTSEYRYQSESGFTTTVRVDDFGLIVSYPRFWKRCATR